MIHSGSVFLRICILMLQLLLLNGQHPVDPEIRAQLEAKVMSSMSLKELEALVENDERVLNVPKKFILVPKPRDTLNGYRPEELDQKAYIIEKKTKYPKKAFSERIGYDSVGNNFRSPYEPRYKFESSFKYDEEFPSMFGLADLESAGSVPVKNFYESLVERVLGAEKTQIQKERDPFSLFEVAASDSIPSYNPRFDYEAYVKDPTETKLKGKSFWRDDYPETNPRKAEEYDEEKRDSKTNGKSFWRDYYPETNIRKAEEYDEERRDSKTNGKSFWRGDYPETNPRKAEEYDEERRDSKTNGKSFWRDDAPERREEKVDENGCRTVVKRVMDPENEKKSNGGRAKSVIITKECEYPNVNGPDAKLTELSPDLDAGSSRLDSEPSTNFDSEVPSYESSRPIELDMEAPKARDPLSPDYIDGMLESHFKLFPGFSNPITSFKGYQDRFKLRTPIAFKEIKPTIDVQSYDYSHPSSGFENENNRETHQSRDLKMNTPEPYKRQYRFEKPQKGEPEYKNSKDVYNSSPKVFDHHYHYDYPETNPRKAEEYDEEKRDSKTNGKKDPKMMKKSFAYYRKDNPKDDPNDHQYAEEFAQGNYRSFSSDYDSDRDGPKKE